MLGKSLSGSACPDLISNCLNSPCLFSRTSYLKSLGKYPAALLTPGPNRSAALASSKAASKVSLTPLYARTTAGS